MRYFVTRRAAVGGGGVRPWPVGEGGEGVPRAISSLLCVSLSSPLICFVRSHGFNA